MIGNISQPIPFQEKNDTNIKIIADYDKNMLNYIGRLYKNLNGDTVDIDDLENIVDVLSTYKKKSEKTYLENLIHPEKAKGCKIPTPIPVPSSSFQLHNSITLTTNSSGNLAFVLNPFYLYNINDNGAIYDKENTVFFKPNYISSLLFCNEDTLDGHTTTGNTFNPINIGQGIPNVYDQYRLVSASLIVRYIGRIDITSGVIGGAIVFDENREVPSSGILSIDTVATTLNTDCSWATKYANFDLAMDSFYHQENLCLEGLRMLYFPIDNTFEEYTKLAGSSVSSIKPADNLGYSTGVKVLQSEDYNKSGFNWMVYVLGAPPNSSCFKIDFYLNFECLPNATFLNYMPITPPCGFVGQQEKKESITIVQNKPVMKSNETIIVKKTNKENAWKKLKKAFSGALPSIGKLITNGLINAIPYLKPGLAIAGNLLDVASTRNVNNVIQNNPNMSVEYEEDVE